MRRPERRPPQEVGHEPHPVPSSANTHGHEPLSRCSRDDGIVGAAVELGLRHAVRPDDPRDVDARARAQAEVHGRPGDRLLLHEQAGPDFDVAADAERVDALIAGDRLRARTERPASDSPRASSQQAHRLARPTVRPGRADRRRSDPRRCERPDPRAAASEPQARCVRPRARRGNDLRLTPPRPARRCCRDRQGARGGCPARAGRTSRARWPASASTHPSGPVRRSADRAVSAERHEVQHAVAVDVTDGQRDRRRGGPVLPPRAAAPRPAGSRTGEVRQPRRRAQHRDRRRRRGRPTRTPRRPDTSPKGRSGRQVPSPLFRSTSGAPSTTPTMTSRSPSISMSAAQAPNTSGKGSAPAPMAIAVASENAPPSPCRSSRRPPSPAASRSILKSWFQSSASSPCGVTAGAAAAGCRQGGFLSVDPGECTSRGGKHRRSIRSVERSRQHRGPRRGCRRTHRLQAERQRLVRWRRCRARRRQRQEAFERLAEERRRDADPGQSFLEGGRRQQHVPEEHQGPRRFSRIRCRHSPAEPVVLLADLRRPRRPVLVEPGRRVAKRRHVAALCGQPGPLEQDREVVRLQREEIVDGRASLQRQRPVRRIARSPARGRTARAGCADRG